MAITTNPADFTAPAFKVGSKAKTVAFYLFIGVVAMGIAIPAALATAGQPF
ncbi:hypothetical protein [Hyphococcus sp.]|jgi:hypothetical protein|uniref:hypothetical protein n=1 Tax=Hyphococcus sp. TaxID=2038636 RepID=UPI003D0DD716